MFKRLLTLALITSIATSCAGEKRYGYGDSADKVTERDAQFRYSTKGRVKAQDRYIRKMAKDDYFSEEDNWEEKLDSRKGQFNSILKREYLEFADQLAKQREHSDASFFRRKGIDAKYADFDLMPEDPTDWKIKDDNEFEELRRTRLELLDSLVGYTPVVAPIAAAKSIVYYDCWVQQSQKKAGQVNSINCRDKFRSNHEYVAGVANNIKNKDIATINKEYRWVDIIEPVQPPKEEPKVVIIEKTTQQVKTPAAVTTTQKTVTKTVAAPAAKNPEVKPLSTPTGNKPSLAYTPAKKPEATTTTTVTTQTTTTAAPTPAKTETAKPQDTGVIGPVAINKKIQDESNDSPDLVYIAYFDGNNAELNANAKLELDKVALQIKENAPKTVTINGHTDRSQASLASLVLSKSRADSAKNYLISKGVPASIIKTYGFGKTDNIVENTEGQSKPANNRAEIIFKGKVD